MLELGKVQTLSVKRIKEFGVYLGEESEEAAVLLPKKQVPEGTKLGDRISVFLYKDSSDRMIATTREPMLQVGEVAVLKVAEKGKIGAFLNWGLEKDLLLPFKEQTYPVKQGDDVLVALYLDKSDRLCATMRVYDYLSAASPYKVDDVVEGVVYQINPEMGAFVAVDNCYYGMIHKSEIFDELKLGSKVNARVSKVRADGKMDLVLRDKIYLQINEDAEYILQVLDEFDGVLPFSEKANPEVIKRELHMSKNAFKRALGHLLKEGKIQINEKSVKKL
ncbi:MAG: S1 RNA-binding domain-containing protein [Lachnospiraceae bacterium]